MLITQAAVNAALFVSSYIFLPSVDEVLLVWVVTVPAYGVIEGLVGVDLEAD